MKTYTKAVSATLAGALAVGMVPAMALADEAAPEVVADDALELLTMTTADAFSKGEVSAAIDATGAAITDLDDIEFQVSDDAQYVVPTTVQPAEGKAIAVDGVQFKVKYCNAQKVDGVWTATTEVNGEPTNPGEYMAVVYATDDAPAAYSGAKVGIHFSIVAKSLKNAKIYEVNTNAADGGVSDKEIVYTGAELKFGVLGETDLGIEVDGVALDKDDVEKVLVYEAGGHDSTADPAKNAGNYVAAIYGKGDYAAAYAEVPFTIEKLDLADLEISLPNLTNVTAAQSITFGSIDQSLDTIPGLPTDYSFTMTASSNGSSIVKQAGSYTFTLAPLATASDDVKKNVEGTAKLTFSVAEYSVANTKLYYDGKALNIDADVDYSKGDVALDLKKFSYSLGANGYDAAKVLPTSAVAYKVVNGKETEEMVTDVSKPGVYNIYVSVDSAATDYEYASDAPYVIQDYTVTNGEIKASDLIVTYDGTVASSITKFYDGKDALDLIQVKVKTANGTKVLTEGTDYTFRVTKKVNGKDVEVAEAVDAATYTLTIESETYEIVESATSKATVAIQVNKVVPAKVRVADQVTVMIKAAAYDANGNLIPAVYATGLAYTGSVITPTFEYYTAEQFAAAELAAEKALNKDLNPVDPETLADNQLQANKQGIADYETVLEYLEWTELPAAVYNATITDPGTKAKPKDGKVEEIGEYEFALSSVKNEPNYNLTGVTKDSVVTATFNVISGSVFKDVPAGKWFTDPVMKAYTLRYMNGIGNQLFDPMGTVTRGMAACILFNMAGGVAAPEGSYDNDKGFVTGFADVNSGMWYAQAVAWAGKAGIVNGWVEGGELVFGPDQDITREQWAAMLCNYAKVYGGFDAPAADALAGFADAGKVSGWAKESVAWAVENGVMGNGGSINAKASIIRAEAAAMAVNYQPQKLA